MRDNQRVPFKLNASMMLSFSALIAIALVPTKASSSNVGDQSKQGLIANCEALLNAAGLADADGLRIVSSASRAATDAAPMHCEVEGILRERVGQHGQKYAVRFRLRLPSDWNGRFLFQGGGGTNGFVHDAFGAMRPGEKGQPTALQRGFAVVATDTGHDNTLNYDVARGGIMAFGHDYQARLELAQTSLDSVATAAKQLITRYYGRSADRSYMMGCSNGGFSGLVFAQRYPDQFDGIIAMAPAMSVPKASIAAVWQTQQFAKVAQDMGRLTQSGLPDIGAAFSDPDLKLAADAIGRACDADDGLQDGLIQNFEACTTQRVLPRLSELQCSGHKQEGCLSASQIDALVQIHEGPRNSRGDNLYPGFPWDNGITIPAWREWKLNRGSELSINGSLMTAGLAAVFMTPPDTLRDDPETILRYALSYDFDRDAPRIFNATPEFPNSGWDLMAATSTNLDRFRARGGKLILPHGGTDTVFSIADTARWWRALDERQSGKASDFARLFNVPGMEHCNSGNTVDQFNAFDALVRWVEQGEAPDRIIATAGTSTPWPGRTRPLCPYPLIARYVGGNPEEAGSFACGPPKTAGQE